MRRVQIFCEEVWCSLVARFGGDEEVQTFREEVWCSLVARVGGDEEGANLP